MHDPLHHSPPYMLFHSPISCNFMFKACVTNKVSAIGVMATLIRATSVVTSRESLEYILEWHVVT